MLPPFMGGKREKVNKPDVERYKRQNLIIGSDGQELLRQSRVLVAGVGGLGNVLAVYLVAAGFGYLRLVDYDRIEISNLNRQVVFQEIDVGREKTTVAKERLSLLNSGIRIEGINRTITDETVDELVQGIDLIVDALDNFSARFILNRASFTHRIPFIHGAVRGFLGQATTFIPGRTACLQCLFAKSPPPEKFSILGGTCGVIASVQATEAIKVVTGKGDLLADRLFFWDGLNGEATTIIMKRNPNCEVCGEHGLEKGKESR